MPLFLRNVVFAVLLGLIAAVIVNGTILLAVYNLPEEIVRPDANDPVVERVAVVIILFLAPLLPTAPLIGWWYGRLGRILKISVETYWG